MATPTRSDVPGRTRLARRVHPGHRGRNVLRVIGLVVVIAVLVAVLKDRFPHPDDVMASLSSANRGWLAIAVLAEVLSISFFARQQRRLLRAFGVKMSLPRAGALSYARSAIAISLPAGSAISAGFAFRQFRTAGASRTTAATVMILSGLASTVALILLYLTGLLATGLAPLASAGEHHPAITVSVGVTLVAAVATVIGVTAHRHAHASRRPAVVREHRRLTAVARRYPRVGTVLRALADALASVRELPNRHRRAVLVIAAANWLTDLGCLCAVAQAFDLEVGLPELALIYLGVQVVRQIPLTPGGIGVVEASLLAGMVSAGAPEGGAAGTVLVYRLLSCWLIIPIGFLAWARLQRIPIAGTGVIDDDHPDPDHPHPDHSHADHSDPDHSGADHSDPDHPGADHPGAEQHGRADPDRVRVDAEQHGRAHPDRARVDAEQHPRADPDPERSDVERSGAEHADPEHPDPEHLGAGHRDAAHAESTHPAPSRD